MRGTPRRGRFRNWWPIFAAEMADERAQNHADREEFFRELAEERVQRHADNTAIVSAVDDLKHLISQFSAAAIER